MNALETLIASHFGEVPKPPRKRNRKPNTYRSRAQSIEGEDYVTPHGGDEGEFDSSLATGRTAEPVQSVEEFYDALDGVEPPPAAVALAELLDWIEEPFVTPIGIPLSAVHTKACKSLLIRNWVFEGGLTCEQIGNQSGLLKQKVNWISLEFHKRFSLPNPVGKSARERLTLSVVQRRLAAEKKP
jgi:hypothetical protein